MEINIRLQPDEAVGLVSALFLDTDTATRLAHAASGASIALGGGLKFTARMASRNTTGEFDRFMSHLVDEGIITEEDMESVVARRQVGDQSDDENES